MATQLERVTKYRNKLRASGLRPVQLWVPDTRRVGFREECLRQSLLLHDDPHETQAIEWLEQMADTEGWR